MLPEPNSYFTLQKYLDHIEKNIPLPYDNTWNVIKHICESIIDARSEKSKIKYYEPLGKDLLELQGYTGTRTRHFYNNICNSDKLSNIKYLEIGTWYGSSSVSSIYNNNIQAYFIDNWSQFNGDLNIFKKNIDKFGNKPSSYNIIESDCWKVNLDTFKYKFNVYLFDGDHTELDHFKSLEYYYPVLEDTFVFLVDDWNWPNVRDGTMRAIDTLNLHVLFRHEEFVNNDDLIDMPNHKGKQTWWNGIGIFLLQKSS
jgi:hypothetical protein